LSTLRDRLTARFLSQIAANLHTGIIPGKEVNYAM